MLLTLRCVAGEVFPGVHYLTEDLREPVAQLHICHIDLTNKQLKLSVVPGGGIPGRTDGKWQTTLQTVPKIADRNNLDVAVNGDFFEIEQPPSDPNGEDGLGALVNRGYREGLRAAVMGSAVTDGTQWATGREARPTLLVSRDGAVSIAEVTEAPAGTVQAISGNPRLVVGGRGVNHRGTDRNARTAIGLNRERTRLTIVVADGLREGRASGLSIPELGREMLRLGCHDAINLDGGGSSTLVVRDGAGGKLRVVNHPTDGKPRAVANVLGVRVGKQ
jgi:exopolysaccharide biosynthesis protein